ncbi:MAG: hypothetical protein WBL67_14075 [Nitrososphaeraceae archaeon]
MAFGLVPATSSTGAATGGSTTSTTLTTPTTTRIPLHDSIKENNRI